jgi:hypothetical protein
VIKLSYLLVAVATVFVASTAYGQKQELGVLIGGVATGNRTVPDSGSVDISTSFAIEGVFDERLLNAHLAALYFEIPVIVTPSTSLSSSNALSPRSYSSVFLTPGLKLKILPVAGFAPYVVLGGGLAHFGSSSTTQNGSTNTGSTGSTSAAYDIGGGVDFRLVPFVGLRAEVRDIVSGNPNFNVPVSGGRQSNVLFAVGVVLRF